MTFNSPVVSSSSQQLIKMDRYFVHAAFTEIHLQPIDERSASSPAIQDADYGLRNKEFLVIINSLGSLGPQKYEFRFRCAATRINGNGLGRLNGWYTG